MSLTSHPGLPASTPVLDVALGKTHTLVILSRSPWASRLVPALLSLFPSSPLAWAWAGPYAPTTVCFFDAPE